jgi:hypothetical protein
MSYYLKWKRLFTYEKVYDMRRHLDMSIFYDRYDEGYDPAKRARTLKDRRIAIQVTHTRLAMYPPDLLA